MQYTIPEYKRDDVTKQLNRISKKAAKYGACVSFDASAPFVHTFPVYKCDKWTKEKVADQPVEVFALSISGDVFRASGYTVAARIEHCKDENGNCQNIVKAFDGSPVRREWLDLLPRCEHCNSLRARKITYMLQAENGDYKQVGSDCLKEFCGIDPQAVGALAELVEILENETPREFDEKGLDGLPVLIPTEKAIAYAIRAYDRQGYVKAEYPGSNKALIREMAQRREEVTDGEKAQAAAMLEYIKAMDMDTAINALLNNVQALANIGYCKMDSLGFVAYAPLAVKRQKERDALEAEREEKRLQSAAVSQYVGKIGERLTISLKKMELLTSWENMYGYTYLYKMEDDAGNVLTWFASRPVESGKKIKATVKSHEERDGVKQTIVTRCAVCA